MLTPVSRISRYPIFSEVKMSEVKLGEKRHSGGEVDWNFCKICDLRLLSQSDLHNHMEGKKHKKMMVAAEEPVLIMGCSLCNVNFTSDSDRENHMKGLTYS